MTVLNLMTFYYSYEGRGRRNEGENVEDAGQTAPVVEQGAEVAAE